MRQQGGMGNRRARAIGVFQRRGNRGAKGGCDPKCCNRGAKGGYGPKIVPKDPKSSQDGLRELFYSSPFSSPFSSSFCLPSSLCSSPLSLLSSLSSLLSSLFSLFSLSLSPVSSLLTLCYLTAGGSSPTGSSWSGLGAILARLGRSWGDLG